MRPTVDVLRARRERVMSALGEGIAIVPAAHPTIRNADVPHPFRQSSDFFYLTGLEIPDAVLLLAPARSERRAVLWLAPPEPDRERWNGPSPGLDEAAAASGADAALPIGELVEGLREAAAETADVYYSLGSDDEIDAMLVAFARDFRGKRREPRRGPVRLHDLAAVLEDTRVIKDATEIASLREAVTLTAAGLRGAAGLVAPGRAENEIRAELERRFFAGGAARTAFDSIVAAGANATFLHYPTGRSTLRRGDLLLVDAGAEVDYLAGDITRTFPVGGAFTEVQRDVYGAVDAVRQAVVDACRPGTRIEALEDIAVRLLTSALVDLGLLKGPTQERIADESYRRYYPHRIGHFLGMDAHDVGRFRDDRGPLELAPGMVLTVEPGIYVPEHDESAPAALRGVGVRIEDDVLITQDGAENLSAELPTDADEVAALVGGDS